MTEFTEEVLQLSDGEAEEIENSTASPAPVTVPKKRGRPVTAEKTPKKIASSRGRGRPSTGSVKKQNPKPTNTEGSQDEGTASDGGSPIPNGDDAAPLKRGRHPKRKLKTAPIEATGKGRGRPKKIKSAEDEEEDEKPVKKSQGKGAKKGRGRPKKVQNSEDESSDDIQDDEQKRSIGRPPSGGTNLNIVRTGKGQGRPKKSVAVKRAAAENGNGNVAKKPGRPATTGKAYSPTGKPRGRPKANVPDKVAEDENDDDIEEKQVEDDPVNDIADEDEDAEKANSEGSVINSE